MSNVDFPRGFIPHGPSLRTTKYPKETGTGKEIYPGDIVSMATDGEVEDDVVTINSNSCALGVAAEYADADDTEILVHDHPDQLFVGQDDGDTTQLALIDLGANLALINTTGDTAKKISKHEIDSSSQAATATLPLRLVRFYEAPDNAIGANARWVVRINNHQLSETTGSA